jgi:hypothetical protein
MKNQYFGDINDYKKYGLLRILCEKGRGLAICWMRTPDDGGPDGRKRRYLLGDQAALWVEYDRPLYRALQRIDSNIPQMSCSDYEDILSCVKDKNILPEAMDLCDLIPEDIEDRREYFTRFLKRARGAELVFFDPDNGLEVPSAPCRRKRSSMHLYTDELWQTFDAGHSILLYQHFARKKRDPFVSETAEHLQAVTGVPEVIPYRTAHVVFFLVAQPNHKLHLCRARAETAWPVKSNGPRSIPAHEGLDYEKNSRIPHQAQPAD